MVAASSPKISPQLKTFHILCDETTYKSAYSSSQQTILFQQLDPIQVKGKQQLIPIFNPTGNSLTIGFSPLLSRERSNPSLNITSESPEVHPHDHSICFVGREQELQQMLDTFKNFFSLNTVTPPSSPSPTPPIADGSANTSTSNSSSNIPNNLLLITGQSGIGRSSLGYEFLHSSLVPNFSVEVISIYCTPLTRYDIYMLWSTLFVELAVPILEGTSCGRTPDETTTENQQKRQKPIPELVMEMLKEDGELIQLAPVISGIIEGLYCNSSFSECLS